MSAVIRPLETDPSPPIASAKRDPRVSASHGDWESGSRWPSLLAIIALHVGVLWGLMQIESVRQAVQDAAPIMVGLITVAPPEPPKPEPPPPKPREVKPKPKPKPKPQMIAAETPAPASERVAPPPEPIVIEEPPPPPPQGEPAPPPPITPPNFIAAYLDNPAPQYPASARRLGEAGTVTLRVRVGIDGRPEAVEVQRSSGFQRLDRAAMDAVRKWKFVPAKQGDQPISASVLVPLTFELKSS